MIFLEEKAITRKYNSNHVRIIYRYPCYIVCGVLCLGIRITKLYFEIMGFLLIVKLLMKMSDGSSSVYYHIYVCVP